MSSLTLTSVAACETPRCNTGSDSQKSSQGWAARPDWLQGTIQSDSLDGWHELLEVLERVCETSFDLRPDTPITRGIKWDGYAVSPHAVQVCYRQTGLTVELWFAIPGQVFSSMAQNKFLSLAAYLHHRNVKITRIDLCIDDFERNLNLSAVAEAARSGQYSGAQRYAIIESGDKSSSQRGMAVVFGSPSSDKRVTIYDKSVESKGRIDSIRIEVRLRDELAQVAWQSLFPHFKPKEVASIVLGSIQFVERGKDKNISRIPRLGWWRLFIKYVSTAPHKIRRTPVLRTFHRSLNWLKRQVSTSLYTLTRVCGPGLLLKLMAIGHSKYIKDSWLKTLEKSFKADLSTLESEILDLGIALDSVLDAVV